MLKIMKGKLLDWHFPEFWLQTYLWKIYLCGGRTTYCW